MSNEKEEGAVEKVKVKCVVEECVNDAKTRGLCPTCYTKAAAAVKKGAVTWDQLVRFGLAKPSSKDTTNDLFNKALAPLLDSSVGAPGEVASDGTEPAEQAATPEGAPTLPWQTEDK